ncbi:guanylylate cyclase domain-containing protein [Phthorimaea operculella]|nr:guanylylate cyclase domain-containing protein [Phthorimaea operculella]
MSTRAASFASFLSTNRHLSKSLFTRPVKKPASPQRCPVKATEKEALPKYVLHEVDHYRQRFNWDCGVSCVLMLLPGDQRRQFLENFTDICKDEGFGESTWTIDLCYLLKR